MVPGWVAEAFRKYHRGELTLAELLQIIRDNRNRQM